jgi:Cof subfamily protein (haloacid dehalogenase superfamily)
MPIRMIVTDLDGTLLRKDKTISEYTESVFQQCRDMGIITVLATARPIRAVKMLNLDWLFDASIFHNGAVVYVGEMNTMRFGVSPEAIKEIVDTAFTTNKSAKICIEIDDRLYGNYDPSDLWPGIEITITDFSDLPAMPADKVIFPMTTMMELNEVARTLPNNLYIEMSENTVGMIMNKDATKSKAIKHLSEHFGIPLSDVAAFGDDYNDIEMLRECGIGVAVENAIEEVRAVADYLCDSSDSDGVAKWLEGNAL